MKSESSLESAFVSILDRLHIKYIQQFQILKYRYDFFLPEYQTLIEIHGSYWHGKSGTTDATQKKNKANDIIKTEIAKNNGFNLKVFWEEQVLFDPESVEKELLWLAD